MGQVDIRPSVWCHVDADGQDQRTLNDQLELLERSGLAAHADIHVVVVGAEASAVELPPGVRLAAHYDDPRTGESATLQELWRCAQKSDSPLFYFHANEQIAPPAEGPGQVMRRHLEYWCVENWKLCVEALEGHDLAGSLWIQSPIPHFSGQMFWAKADYIRRLPSPPTDAKEARLWHGSGGAAACGYHAPYAQKLGEGTAEPDEVAGTFDPMSADVEAARIAGSDSTHVFGGGFEGGYKIQQNPEELAALLAYLRIRTASGGPGIGEYLEVGVASGGTARYLGDQLPIWRMSGADDGKHPTAKAGLQDENLRGAKFPGGVRMFRGNVHSAEYGEQLKEWDTKFDVALIDADHNYSAVRTDTLNVIPWVKPGGLIVLHDSEAISDVKRWTNELVANPSFGLILRWKTKRALGVSVFEVR
jgi:hypothetical protein